jgi:tRNA-Thr(GGU) m(6)t(6)A37 methyltransferase TsaA
MAIEMEPIGFVSTSARDIPRSWSISDVEGDLIIDERFREGMRDIQPGQRIYVLFHFHRSPPFNDRFLRINPPVRDKKIGVFSTHSPFRRNPIGLSILEVLDVSDNCIHVRGLDMFDQTPILDIKPEECPSP